MGPYLTRGAGLDGAADGKKGIFSCWFRIDGGGAVAPFGILGMLHGVTTLGGGTSRVRIRRQGGGATPARIEVFAANAAGTTIISKLSATEYIQSATWHHLLISWDLSVPTISLYVDGLDDLDGGGTLTDDDIDYTVADWGVGGTPAGTQLFDGALAEVGFWPGQYLDFSIDANRLKYRDANGRPPFLGHNGSRPTGAAALAYFGLRKGEAVANFALNRGTGGDFTINAGPLATADSSPTD